MRSHVFHRARLGLLVALAATVLGCSSGSDSPSDPCLPDDADGVNGTPATSMLTVDDTAFTPSILHAENVAKVTLILKNVGTKPHGLVFACLPTPNSNGCPATSCFDSAASITTLAPGATVTRVFETPNPEGIYPFSSPIAGDKQTGQFIVQ